MTPNSATDSIQFAAQTQPTPAMTKRTARGGVVRRTGKLHQNVTQNSPIASALGAVGRDVETATRNLTGQLHIE